MPIKKNVNGGFFKKWSPEMAYVLGFFFADGTITKNKNGSSYFVIQISDQILLENIRKALGSEHKISKRIHLKYDSIFYRLQIGSKELIDGLKQLGVVPNKTSRMKFPDIPERYTGSFIRGYFDGDGNVWSGQIHKKRATQRLTILTAFTSCSKDFLLDLQETCSKYKLGNGSLFKIKNSNAYRLQYSAKDSIILFNLMYGKPIYKGLFLERKKRVFEEFTESQKLRS